MLSSNSSSALHSELPAGGVLSVIIAVGIGGIKLCSAIEGLICLFQGRLVETMVVVREDSKRLDDPPPLLSRSKNILHHS